MYVWNFPPNTAVADIRWRNISSQHGGFANNQSDSKSLQGIVSVAAFFSEHPDFFIVGQFYEIILRSSSTTKNSKLKPLSLGNIILQLGFPSLPLSIICFLLTCPIPPMYYHVTPKAACTLSHLAELRDTVHYTRHIFIVKTPLSHFTLPKL